jgi:glycosyltransferase involved in cell wall biosynthesis
VAARIGCSFDVILHDYYFICPRVNAVGGGGRFCGLASVETCRPCIETFGSEVGGVDPAVWRQTSLGCLMKADRIYVPSRDTARRIEPFLAGRTCAVWEPEADDNYPPQIVPEISANRPMRVAVLGSLNVAKGSQVLLALADEVSRKHAPIRFTVLGPSDETAALRAQGVFVHGRYDTRDFAALIAEAAPDVVFLPAIWPETWSFVLSSALDIGLPIVAFDIGAPADRLRRLGRGHVLPIALASDPIGLLDAFMDLRNQWAKPR